MYPAIHFFKDYTATIIENPYLLHSIMPITFNQTREPLDPVSFLYYSLVVQKLTANNNKQVYLINLPLYVPQVEVNSYFM